MKGSTSLNGFVDIIDLHGYSQSLRMHTKTPTGPSLNYATLSIETAGYKNLKMTFDHYTGYDQSDAYVGSLPATGLVDADGIMISDGSTDKWHLLWTPPTLPSLRTGGRFWTTSIEVDIGALLIAKNLNPNTLKIRFQQFDPYARLNADGRGWDNIKLSASPSPIPEPTTILMALVGSSSAWLVRRQLRSKPRLPKSLA